VVQIFFKRVLSNFAYMSQIQIYCCKANHTTCVMLYRISRCFSTYFVKYSVSKILKGKLFFLMKSVFYIT